MSGARNSSFSRLFSLRGRLLFLICLATLPALLFTFFVAQNERTAAVARTERDALHLASLASREHAHQIRGARELLAWLGGRLSREGLSSPIIEDQSFLGAILAGHPQLANIGVLSAAGQVLASAHPLASYRTWKDNPAYLAAVRSTEVEAGTYVISPIFARPTLNHAYAVRDAGQQVIALVFSGLDLGWLSEMARQSALPAGFSLHIADREGHVLASSGLDRADAAPAGDLSIAGISDLSESRRGRLLAVGDASARQYFVAAPLDSTDLYVAVGLPYQEVVRQANSTFYRTLIGLGILTVFIITAVFIAAEIAVLRGLRSLARVAQRFGAGELSIRARPPRAHHEIASLTIAFNAMADSLAARHRDAIEAQARLRALASRLQEAREKEAARISRELHDEIGQVLTSLKIDLSHLRSRCSSSEQKQVCQAALAEASSAMSRQIDAALGFVRRISSDLRPGVLDKLGLVAALEWQAREVENRTGLVVQVEADVRDAPLDELVAVSLFRIAQEALNNVVRHARAHLVEVSLVTTEANAVLTIHDDGEGIPPAAVESGESLGIIGMRERAMLIDGRLEVRGSARQGTTVTVTVPLSPDPGRDDAHPAG